jgi:hypothetical protein
MTAPQTHAETSNTPDKPLVSYAGAVALVQAALGNTPPAGEGAERRAQAKAAASPAASESASLPDVPPDVSQTPLTSEVADKPEQAEWQKVGDEARQRGLNMGIGRNQLQILTGLSESTCRAFLYGKRTLSPSEISTMLEAFGYTPEEMRNAISRYTVSAEAARAEEIRTADRRANEPSASEVVLAMKQRGLTPSDIDTLNDAQLSNALQLLYDNPVLSAATVQKRLGLTAKQTREVLDRVSDAIASRYPDVGDTITKDRANTRTWRDIKAEAVRQRVIQGMTIAEVAELADVSLSAARNFLRPGSHKDPLVAASVLRALGNSDEEVHAMMADFAASVQDEAGQRNTRGIQIDDAVKALRILGLSAEDIGGQGRDFVADAIAKHPEIVTVVRTTRKLEEKIADPSVAAHHSALINLEQAIMARGSSLQHYMPQEPIVDGEIDALLTDTSLSERDIAARAGMSVRSAINLRRRMLAAIREASGLEASTAPETTMTETVPTVSEPEPQTAPPPEPARPKQKPRHVGPVAARFLNNMPQRLEQDGVNPAAHLTTRQLAIYNMFTDPRAIREQIALRLRVGPQQLSEIERNIALILIGAIRSSKE